MIKEFYELLCIPLRFFPNNDGPTSSSETDDNDSSSLVRSFRGPQFLHDSSIVSCPDDDDIVVDESIHFIYEKKISRIKKFKEKKIINSHFVFKPFDGPDDKSDSIGIVVISLTPSFISQQTLLV